MALNICSRTKYICLFQLTNTVRIVFTNTHSIFYTHSDVDECSSGTHKCSNDAKCDNIEGSYVCQCAIGSVLQNDKRTCRGTFILSALKRMSVRIFACE